MGIPSRPFDADEHAVRALAHAFADCVNRRDDAGLRELFTDDARLELRNPVEREVEGGDTVVQALHELLEGWELFVHMVHSGVATRVDADRFTTRWHVQEIGRPVGGGGHMNLGVYDDEVRRTDDGWRYTRRVYQYLYTDDRPVTGLVLPLHHVAPFDG